MTPDQIRNIERYTEAVNRILDVHDAAITALSERAYAAERRTYELEKRLVQLEEHRRTQGVYFA